MPTKREKEIARDNLLESAVREIKHLKQLVEELIKEVKDEGKSSKRTKKTS